MPAKVTIGDSFQLPLPPKGTTHVTFDVTPERLPQSQGCWVNAVLEAMPFLDAKGLQTALTILDQAITNVHKAKALDNLIACACTALDSGTSKAGMPSLLAAELMRAEVCEQQRVLLGQLQSLRNSGAVLGSVGPHVGLACGPTSTAPTYTGGQTLGIGPAARQLAAPPRPPAAAWTAGGVAQAKKPGGERGISAPAPHVQTLSLSLQMLATEDPDCLFIVRRINKLGFKACRKLKQHFAAYGPVVRVLVAHSTVRQSGDPQSQTRRRPSSLGFVHMVSPAAVRAVLLAGEEHDVEGSAIRVQRFERQPSELLEEEDEGDYRIEGMEMLGMEGNLPKDWERQGSCSTTTSTRADNSVATYGESDGSSNDKE